MKFKALVLGEDTRSFLSVIRSLGKMGGIVDIICYDKTSPALGSKYINNAWFINYQAYTQQDWLSNVIEIIQKNDYDIIVPCDERAMFPINDLKETLPTKTKIATPNRAVLDNLFDKNKTRDVAKQCGVRVAKGEVLSLYHATYEALAEKFTDKFVIKPIESFSKEKLSSRNLVGIVSDKESFLAYKTHIKPENDLFLIEEFFEGTGEGVSLFACNGKVQYLFAHTRVNEPRRGGGSSYRKSIPVQPSMAEACVKICEKLGYDGVGMFEFKRNQQTNEWILVEVNARFWGSLPLAIYSGIDFPRLYTEYLLGTYQVSDSVEQSAYKTHLFARNLSNDFYDIRSEMISIGKEEGTYKSFLHAMMRFGTLARVLRNEKIDTLDSNDKEPFFKEVKAFYNQAIKNKFSGNQKNRLDQEKFLADIHKIKAGEGKIIFVCYGNIMRSAFSEKLFKKMTLGQNIHNQIDSYGFHQNENRPSPDDCIRYAKEFGVDLEPHRSKWLTQADISDNDIVFIYDDKNQQMCDKYYNIKNLYNLTDFVPEHYPRPKEIYDPYARGYEELKKCYDYISASLNNVSKMIS